MAERVVDALEVVDIEYDDRERLLLAARARDLGADHFGQPAAIAEKVIAALAEPEAFSTIRRNARQTIVENYDLKRVCLPGQLRLLAAAGK